MKKRLIIGISGASGFTYGIKALEVLRGSEVETHLIVSSPAKFTAGYETDISPEEVYAMADFVHDVKDIGASVSSGSYKTCGMLIAPCSINTMSSIAHGITNNLLTRAADVVLKERRRLVLMVRETPFHAGHLKSMLAVTEMGGIIYPPVPAFYKRPRTLDDIVTHSVGRALDLFDIDVIKFPRWGEKE